MIFPLDEGERRDEHGGLRLKRRIELLLRPVRDQN
jgi:hypothetical protein